MVHFVKFVDMLTMIGTDVFDLGCIWFTIEAHVHLDVFVTRQYWRFLRTQNAHLSEARPLHL